MNNEYVTPILHYIQAIVSNLSVVQMRDHSSYLFLVYI